MADRFAEGTAELGKFPRPKYDERDSEYQEKVCRREQRIPRLIGYARISTAEQATRGVSMDDQRDRIKADCAPRLSSWSGSRKTTACRASSRRTSDPRSPEPSKRSSEGRRTVKLDRLSRSVRDVLDLADSAQREGWRLVSLSESLDTETPTGRFALVLLAALAQLEREKISERVGEALDHVARRRARSRFTPYGWRTPSGNETTAGGGRLELVAYAALERRGQGAAEQRVLRRLVALRDQGLGATRRIAAELNRRGVNPRSGRPWAPEGVAAILRRLERWEEAGVAALAS